MIRINIFRRRQKEMAEFDKSLEYISQTQTLVGQKKRELLDRETGENLSG